jgi:hypothetical protein
LHFAHLPTHLLGKLHFCWTLFHGNHFLRNMEVMEGNKWSYFQGPEHLFRQMESVFPEWLVFTSVQS